MRSEFCFIFKTTGNMQYARYGKPTGTSYTSIKKAMKGKGKMPIFTPQRAISSAMWQLNKQELKAADVVFSALTVDSTMELPASTLNNVTQGDTVSSREGNSIMVKSIEWNFDFSQQPAAATTAASIVHFWLIQDRQPNGAAPGVTTIFTSDNAAQATAIVGQQYRFKVLKKDVLVFNAAAGVSGAFNQCCQNLQGYYKFKKPVQVRFSGNAGTVADVTTNNFFIVMGSTYSDDTVVYTGWTRIRFTG